MSCESTEKDKNISLTTSEPETIERISEENPWTYQVLWQRDLNYTLQNEEIIDKINQWLKEANSSDIDENINFLLKLSNEYLEFSFTENDNNPNSLVDSKKANCIGYASFFTALFHYIIKEKQWEERYQCKQVVGKIYYQNQDVHQLFNDPFFADHDFVIIEEVLTKDIIVVDPSLYSYLGVSRINLKN